VSGARARLESSAASAAADLSSRLSGVADAAEARLCREYEASVAATLRDLVAAGFTIAALTPEASATDIDDVVAPDRLVVCMGAERVGLSSSPCWRRIKRLEDAGIIQRRVTILDREQLGLRFEVYCTVKLSLPTKENLELFESNVVKWA
jgi:hypothetical protein